MTRGNTTAASDGSQKVYVSENNENISISLI